MARGQPPAQLRVRWTPLDEQEWEEKLMAGGAQLVSGVLRREGLPQRLTEALCSEAGMPLDRFVGGMVGFEWPAGTRPRLTLPSPSMAHFI
jgi:hypothetical protein